MNSIHGFLRRFLPRRNINRDEFSFELLRSASARELKKSSTSKQHLWPRPASAHDHLHINAPNLKSEDMIEVLGENGDGINNDESALLGFIENSCNAPSCSSYSGAFSSEDSSLDRAIAECSIIRMNYLLREGVLLKCVDPKPLYLFMHYAIFKNSNREMRVAQIDNVINELNAKPKSQLGAYDEIYVIQKVSAMTESKLPSHRHAGYIAISFKLLDEQTKNDSLERSWLSWSGAREIYKYAPRNWNLRRIALHKHPKTRKTQHLPFAYVLLCEFGNIFHPANRLGALDMVERLRVRNCGYISLYQVQWSYGQLVHSSETPYREQNISRRDRNLFRRGFSQEAESSEMTHHRSPKTRNFSSNVISSTYREESPVFRSFHHFTDFG